MTTSFNEGSVSLLTEHRTATANAQASNGFNEGSVSLLTELQGPAGPAGAKGELQ